MFKWVYDNLYNLYCSLECEGILHLEYKDTAPFRPRLNKVKSVCACGILCHMLPLEFDSEAATKLGLHHPNPASISRVSVS